MPKSQLNLTWIKSIYQPKSYQTRISVGFDEETLSPMCIVINSFIDTLDLLFFDEYVKNNKIIGGRKTFQHKELLKILLYALYANISIRQLKTFYSLESELHFLSLGLPHFPKRSIFTKFLSILDNHIDHIFNLSIDYFKKLIELDLDNLYCDGTIFEAHNNRHKIVTDRNVNRSDIKWSTILEDSNSTIEMKLQAERKLSTNNERMNKLKELNRSSYGRTDVDCVLLLDKNDSYIAGYNVQFVEEGKHGLIVFAHISNKNPDSAVFQEMSTSLFETYSPKNITMDTGYGTPEILRLLKEYNVSPVVKALKNENASKKITDYSFSLSENDEYLICPSQQLLSRVESKVKDKVAFKSNTCQSCSIKRKCLDKNSKFKRVTLDIEEFKLLKNAHNIVRSDEGVELYSHRGNKCESPNGFIKYNLNGKKLQMNGLTRNNTIIKLYSILNNLRRLITIKSKEN